MKKDKNSKGEDKKRQPDGQKRERAKEPEQTNGEEMTKVKYTRDEEGGT